MKIFPYKSKLNSQFPNLKIRNRHENCILGYISHKTHEQTHKTGVSVRENSENRLF